MSSDYTLRRLVFQNLHFEEPTLRTLEGVLKEDRLKVLQKIAFIICSHLGNFTFESATLTGEVREACEDRLRLWQEVRQAYKQGKNIPEIKYLPSVRHRLAQEFVVSLGPSAEEIVLSEALLSTLASPMPVHEMPFFKRPCLTDLQQRLLETQLKSQSAHLYQLLSPNPPELTAEEFHQVENFFYSKAWGVIRQKYIRWVHIVHLWENEKISNRNKVSNLVNRFDLHWGSICIVYPVQAQLTQLASQANQLQVPTLYFNDPGFKAYSVKLTLQAFIEKLELELGPRLQKIIFQELYEDEMLRGELFICMDYNPEMNIAAPRYGSPVFKEVFAVIQVAVQLKRLTALVFPWFIESLYFSTPDIKLSVELHLKDNNLDFFRSLSFVHRLFQNRKLALSVENMLRIALLIRHPLLNQIVQDIQVIIEMGLSKNFETFLLYFLQNPELNSYSERLPAELSLIKTKLATCFDLLSPPDDAVAIELSVFLICNPDRNPKVDQFITLFTEKLPFRIEGTILYRALHRFCEEKFTPQDVEAIQRLPFTLSSAERVELFIYPLPSARKSSPQALQRVTELQAKYSLIRLQSVRLFLQLGSENYLTNSYEYESLIDSLHNNLGSRPSGILCFNLLFDQPFSNIEKAHYLVRNYLGKLQSLDERVEGPFLSAIAQILRQELAQLAQSARSSDYANLTAKPRADRSAGQEKIDIKRPLGLSDVAMDRPSTVQQLIHLLDEQFIPCPQHVLQFLEVDWQDADNSSPVLLPQKLQCSLFLLNSDLPLGRVMIGQWHTPESQQSYPSLELIVIDPSTLSARSLSCPWEISVKDLKKHPYLLKILPRMAQLIIQKTPLFRRASADIPLDRKPTDLAIKLEDDSPLAASLINDEEIRKLWEHFIPAASQKEEYAKQTLNFIRRLLCWQYVAQRELIKPAFRSIKDFKQLSQEPLQGNIYLVENLDGRKVSRIFYSLTTQEQGYALPAPLIDKIPWMAKKIRANLDIELSPAPESLEVMIHLQIERIPLFWQFDAKKCLLTFFLKNKEVSWHYPSFLDHPNLEKLIQIQLLMLLTRFYQP
jgi:hypothetical protein